MAAPRVCLEHIKPRKGSPALLAWPAHTQAPPAWPPTARCRACQAPTRPRWARRGLGRVSLVWRAPTPPSAGPLPAPLVPQGSTRPARGSPHAHPVSLGPTRCPAAARATSWSSGTTGRSSRSGQGSTAQTTLLDRLDSSLLRAVAPATIARGPAAPAAARSKQRSTTMTWFTIIMSSLARQDAWPRPAVSRSPTLPSLVLETTSTAARSSATPATARTASRARPASAVLWARTRPRRRRPLLSRTARRAPQARSRRYLGLRPVSPVKRANTRPCLARRPAPPARPAHPARTGQARARHPAWQDAQPAVLGSTWARRAPPCARPALPTPIPAQEPALALPMPATTTWTPA